MAKDLLSEAVLEAESEASLAQAQVQIMEVKLSKANQEILRLKAEVEKHIARANDLQAECVKIRKECDQREVECEGYEKKCADLQAKLNEALVAGAAQSAKIAEAEMRGEMRGRAEGEKMSKAKEEKMMAAHHETVKKLIESMGARVSALEAEEQSDAAEDSTESESEVPMECEIDVIRSGDNLIRKMRVKYL